MKSSSLIILLILSTLLAACNVSVFGRSIFATPTATTIPPSDISAISPTPDISLSAATSVPNMLLPIPLVDNDKAVPAPTNQAVMNRAFEVIQALMSRDMLALSGYVHPGNGLRFSPYAYVNDTDQVFSADKVANLAGDNTVYNWGNYSGSGEPINLTFIDYYARFIYDVDFANAPQLSLDHRLSTGNSLDNSAEFYPGSKVVEFYFPGSDPQYGGMDWRSLRLVFTDYNGDWVLAGIIHDEWTP